MAVNLHPNREQVAIHACFGAPVYQDRLHFNGLVASMCPAAGTHELGLTDDFGNLVTCTNAMLEQWVATLHDFSAR